MKHLPDIFFRVIEHGKQRYNTSGDFFFKNKTLQVRVSKMEPDYEFLIFCHEMIEFYLTQKKGITIKQIDDFDITFEKERIYGDTNEPGDDVKAPYYKEHQFATAIERLIAVELGIDWKRYDAYVDKL